MNKHKKDMNQLPSQRTIPWNDLLLLLDGQTVHLPIPKTHFSKDVAVKSDTDFLYFLVSTSLSQKWHAGSARD